MVHKPINTGNNIPCRNRQAFLYYQAGGSEPLRAMQLQGSWQHEMQAIACAAPEPHGAMMDAPSWLGRGVWR